MTRLTSRDISGIKAGLQSYDSHLVDCTGYSMLEIACASCAMEVDFVRELAARYRISVVPVTSGLGVITTFSETVAAILNYLGFSAQVSETTDVTGFAGSVEAGANGVFMADDNRFIAYDLSTQRIVDNSEATGRIYATALSLMNTMDFDRHALVIGCGPVGCSAARQLLKSGWDVTLYDLDKERTESVCRLLGDVADKGAERVRAEVRYRPEDHNFIVDATPSTHVINEGHFSPNTRIVIPGVPPGISAGNLALLGSRVIHDKLELGVAAMAVSLL